MTLPPTDPFIREVASPLDDHMLRPPGRSHGIVQFKSALTDDDYRLLSAWLAHYPGIELRAYASYDGSIRDLDFLRFFPTLTRFSTGRIFSLQSIEGLNYLPASTAKIGLGQTKARFSLEPFARFTRLHRLFLDGHVKDIEAIGALQALQSVTLRSITLPGLSVLKPLTALRSLELKLGGTRNLTDLPYVGKLEYLELWRIRGLDDISPISDLTHLRYLFLQTLSNVTNVPDLSRLTSLETVWFETLKGLKDLSGLLTAPVLRNIALIDMVHMRPADVGILASHPSLGYLRAGLGSKRKNDAVAKLVPLPNETDWARPDAVRSPGW